MSNKIAPQDGLVKYPTQDEILISEYIENLRARLANSESARKDEREAAETWAKAHNAQTDRAESLRISCDVLRNALTDLLRAADNSNCDSTACMKAREALAKQGRK